MGPLNSFILTAAGGIGGKTFILLLRQNSLRNDVGICSACCDQPLHTQTLIRLYLCSRRNPVSYNQNPEFPSRSPEYATSLIAHIRFFYLPLFSAGMAAQHTPPSPSPFEKRCTVKLVLTVFEFSGNVISMMVPSMNTSFQSCW